MDEYRSMFLRCNIDGLNRMLANVLNWKIRKYNLKAGEGHIQTKEPIIIWEGIFNRFYDKEVVQRLDVYVI